MGIRKYPTEGRDVEFLVNSPLEGSAVSFSKSIPLRTNENVSSKLASIALRGVFTAGEEMKVGLLLVVWRRIYTPIIASRG
jgi:hypothetical protein